MQMIFYQKIQMTHRLGFVTLQVTAHGPHMLTFCGCCRCLYVQDHNPVRIMHSLPVSSDMKWFFSQTILFLMSSCSPLTADRQANITSMLEQQADRVMALGEWEERWQQNKIGFHQPEVHK